MMKAIIFDLDGTLVQTESLKAESYARAATALSPHSFEEEEVIEAFKEVVGLSRSEVAKALLERFGLEKAATGKMKEFNVPTPWQAFVQVRMGIYEAMISDPKILRRHLCPHNAKLLRWANQKGFLTGLATMSHCAQTSRVLEILRLGKQFDFIATRDDVALGKPDPEIYTLVARELGVSADECLVIEDSAAGIRAALAAGMSCVAVTTEFTRRAVYESGLLDDPWIVDTPSDLQAVVERLNDVASRDAGEQG
jgi:beta-phosphoglucomutase